MSQQKEVVYVIDDDSQVRSGLVNLFESVGLQAHAFGSTAEFLAIPRPDAPECLVLDVRLSGGRNGVDFQSELANVNDSIPIIFITGYGDIQLTTKAIKAGAVDVLTKPLREQDVLDAVQTAISQNTDDREQNRRLAALRGRFEMLSSREREVIALVMAGNKNKQIAAEIGISEITVKFHRNNVMKKMGARTLPDLVRIVLRLGVIS